MHHHARLIFVFLVEMGFHHVSQAGLQLLTSGDPPTLACQSARIAGVRHHTQGVDFRPVVREGLPEEVTPKQKHKGEASQAWQEKSTAQ